MEFFPIIIGCCIGTLIGHFVYHRFLKKESDDK